MFKLGEKVKLKGSKIFGTIYKINQKNDYTKYYINTGDKKIIINEYDIEKYNNNRDSQSFTQKNNKYNIENYTKKFTPEITIRHQTLDIAMYNVENFINEAINLGVKNIKIIHGRNGGILRKAVHEYLKHNKNVERYRLGNYYEGSYGVTIIKLK